MDNLKDSEIVQDTNDNGTIENVHISPIGEFQGSDADGNAVYENITADALQKMADELNEKGIEVLCDVDHGAAMLGAQKDTKAAGWFSRFIVDPIKGLFAKLNLTRHGRELLENREYRFISPTFALDDDGTPVELHTASLTNLPAFKGHIKPVLNQEASETTKKTESITDMTKEELVDLIKETVKGLESEKKDETAEETKEEVKEDGEAVKEDGETAVEETKQETAENACSDETKNETPEPEAEKAEEEAVEETEEEEPEEKKEEVIKIEALNTAPKALADVSKKGDWMNLHGKEFWDYLAKHPEIKG